jgi:NAD(P)-dependent dehydrogenase (short-subunit alcohol dehydrogenase family)
VRRQEEAVRIRLELGEKFVPLIFGVTDPPVVLKVAEKVKQQLNGEGLGGLINNSGISVTGPLQYLTMEELRRNFDANVFGLVVRRLCDKDRPGLDPICHRGSLSLADHRAGHHGGNVAPPLKTQ